MKHVLDGKGAGVLDLADVRGLEPLGTLDHLELYAISFGKRAEAISNDGGVVDENILATILSDEAEPLCIIEPLNRALRHCYNLLKGSPKAPGNPQSL